MTTDNVRQVLARAIAEPEFRGRLLANPAQALAGYDLTEDEAAALHGLRPEGFDEAAAALEARVSRATFNLNAQPTGFPPLDAQPSGFPPLA